MGIGGSSSGGGNPIFGVLNSSEGGNGLGATALTIYDNNIVDTHEVQIDDGNGNMTFGSGATLRWTSTYADGTADTGISRDGAGVFDFGNGTQGNKSATLKASAVTLTGTIKTGGYTVSTLPAGSTGMRAYVTDQTTACPAVGAALTGGGSIVCPVFYNGSAWVSG